MLFLNQLINGLHIGSIYALIALGYTMVYGIVKLINFAHGDIIMVGAYVSLLLITNSGLPYYLAFPAAVAGNIIPAPFIIVYIRRIFQWMRRRIPRLNGMVDRLERKAHLKGEKVTRYQYLGLWLFVAIPLPGTGAWTGALAAAFLEMRLRKALPAVILGVLTAGCIMLTLTHVGINLFSGAV